MINLLKFKTIPDIFTHNFEALCRWRPLMHNPHEMPDAARSASRSNSTIPKLFPICMSTSPNTGLGLNWHSPTTLCWSCRTGYLKVANIKFNQPWAMMMLRNGWVICAARLRC